jgi:hypothetical protein
MERFVLPLILAVGPTVFVWFILESLFRYLREPVNLEMLARDYDQSAAENWHESRSQDADKLIRIPQQPFNTWTNLAYIAAGMFVSAYDPTPASTIFVFIMTYVSISSALYHATSTNWAGRLDVIGTYMIFAGLATYALAGVVHRAISPTEAPGYTLKTAVATVVIYCVTGLIAELWWHKKEQDGWYFAKLGLLLLPTLLLLVVHIVWFPGENAPEIRGVLGYALIFFAISVLFWVPDRIGKPLVGKYGHSVWHVGTAVGIALLFYAVDLSAGWFA